MNVKKYVVAWHEENDAGKPKHVMGVELFDTRKDAEAWIDRTVKEDLDRHSHQRHLDAAFLDETVDDGIVHTYGNGQHCMYCVQEIEVADRSEELIGELKAIFRRPLDSAAKYMLIHSTVYDFERKYAPKRKYRVDVRFTPMVCVHGIEATSADEAERIVSNMIDDRTLKVRAEDIMDGLLENVESVGDAEEDKAEEEMHKKWEKSKIPRVDEEVIELCPHCDKEARLELNAEKVGYKTKCPHCGNTLLLCDACHQDGNDNHCDKCNEELEKESDEGKEKINLWCNGCEEDIVVLWNAEKDGYVVHCPRCGSPQNLCDECRKAGDTRHMLCEYEKDGVCVRAE